MGFIPRTLRLYEREGLLKPSRTEGNTRLYTDEDLQRLEFILSLARDLGVNISGMAIILQMRERMEEMQRQIQEFVQYIQEEVLTRAHAAGRSREGSDCAGAKADGGTHDSAREKAAIADPQQLAVSSWPFNRLRRPAYLNGKRIERRDREQRRPTAKC